jgi:membrane protein implicated in regulation of membrane protease activity
MAWWGWIAVGALLLAAEMFWIDAEFYLVFLGLSALAVGALALAGATGPVWAQWLIFALLAAATLALFRGRLHARISRGAVGRPDGVAGETVVASERIGPGGRGRAELRGVPWMVHNDGDAPLEVGARARVERADGLVLHVRAEPAGR